LGRAGEVGGASRTVNEGDLLGQPLDTNGICPHNPCDDLGKRIDDLREDQKETRKEVKELRDEVKGLPLKIMEMLRKVPH